MRDGPMAPGCAESASVRQSQAPREPSKNGAPGIAASAAKIEADGSRTTLEAMGGLQLVPGEWIAGVESGGGGYGDPLQRDPTAVLHDVREGWVSPDAARDVYGVVLTGGRATADLAVDATATQRRRDAA